MSASAGTVAWASLNGTFELLALCSAGAYLAHRGVLNGKAVLTLSESTLSPPRAFFFTASSCRQAESDLVALVRVVMVTTLLIPAMIYYSMVEGLQAARENMTLSSVAEIVFPPLWCIVVLSIGLAVAVPSTWLLARGKMEPVRRAIIVCIMVGNGRSMPLLIMSALCDNFAPFRSDTRCVARAAELVSLFCIVWNFVLWVPVFAYMVSAPDAEPEGSVEDPLVLRPPPIHVKKTRPLLPAHLGRRFRRCHLFLYVLVFVFFILCSRFAFDALVVQFLLSRC